MLNDDRKKRKKGCEMGSGMAECAIRTNRQQMRQALFVVEGFCRAMAAFSHVAEIGRREGAHPTVYEI